ncbi:MAG: DUF748 domain-containing protein [Bacteroidetes bacterium]|nr:DUF748 domain-containing protein [Bacteroidota bacterium]
MTGKENLQQPQKKRKKWKIVLISIIAILIIARLILPFVVLKFVNKTLAGIKGYYGHVEDVDIALIRGAYKINDLKLVKKDTLTNQQDSIPFFTTPEIDLSVEWKAIFKGRIVGEIEVEEPVLNFVQGKHKDENLKQDTTDFKEVIKKLMPLTINRFQINNGQIHFKDPYANPVIDVALKNIQVKAENLSNVNDSNKVLPSSINATGDVYGGNFKLNVKLNALEKQPTFDLNAGVNNVEMVNLNPFFKEYAKFEVEKGNFGLYIEFAAKSGAFKGYVKPLIKDLKVAKEGKFTQVVWQSLVQGVANLLENNKTDKVATKVPIKGRFDDPSTGLWTAISYILKNAFVFALQPSVDNSIDIGKVEAGTENKTFLQKIFGKKEKKEN